MEGVSQAEIEQHLNMGMQLLAKAQYADALSHFHSAIGNDTYNNDNYSLTFKFHSISDADPNNYMSYYKRATVFLALSRSKPALADLDKVLQIKSDFQTVTQKL